MRPVIAFLLVASSVIGLGCSEFDRLRIRAHLGGADSQILVGYAYDTGKGADRDPVAAVKWYRRAAEQGHPKAFGLLGEKYRLGDGVRRDLVQAHMFLTLAARRGETRVIDLVRRLERELSDEQIAESLRRVEAWDASH